MSVADKLKEKIVRILDKTSKLEGIECIADFKHELGYRGRYIDNYLAVAVLGELIEKGIIELKFNEPKNHIDRERVNYFKKLLKEE